MKAVLLSIGKTDNPIYTQLIDDYKKRLNFYIPFETEFLPGIKIRKNISEKEQKSMEGTAILNWLQKGDYVVLLDDKGKQYTSTELARFMEIKSHVVSKRIVFVIGGPYGFSEDIYKRANEKISLSKMTFTHQMVRLIFVEQLYRAMTILNNEPYHHE